MIYPYFCLSQMNMAETNFTADIAVQHNFTDVFVGIEINIKDCFWK